jgi:PAS domain S-box-containing protein
MEINEQLPNLSVMDIAEICGVARSTVSYWIARKSLQACRSGKKHLVTVDDLIFFLKSESQPIPQILLEQVGGIYSQPFKLLKPCWEFWADHSHGKKCQHCVVFTHQARECFSAKSNQNLQCPIRCPECQYFAEYYGPRVAFIHQIDKPAVIYKNLCLWSGNRAWAELCGVSVGELIGAGIEEFVHPDSLRTVISYDKRRVQGDPTVPDRYQVALSPKSGGKIEVYLTISPLTRPANTWLAVAEDSSFKTNDNDWKN